MQVNHYFTYMIKLHKVKIDNSWFIKKINNNFINFIILDPYIDDSDLKKFNHINYINLSYCSKITNKGLKCLSKCKIIKLKCCNISDSGLKYLSKCKKINLSHCAITNKGLKYLKLCKEINLSYTKVTNKGLKYLKSCEKINLIGCNIDNLNNIHKFNIIKY